MITLRSRLTLLYAALVGVVLIALAVVLTRFAFEYLTQPTSNAVAVSLAAANAVISEHPGDASPTTVAMVIAVARRPGVVAFETHHGPRPGGAGPPPRAGGLADDSLFWLRSLLGLRPHRVVLANGKAEVLIAPDLHALEPAVTLYLQSLAGSVVLALGIAWVLGRWITAQAIAPLVTVTAELRRFANGDFTPREVSSTDRSELGHLIEAYNGAAAQVAAAFAERIRVEEQVRRFVADAGHELRTPLTVVSAFIDVLERGGVDDAQIRARAFRTLRVETRRMRRLVERLMVLARLDRPDAGDNETLDVAEIAEGAIAEVAAARAGDVALHLGGGSLLMQGDRGELHQAIGNLVENALKYGGESAVSVDVCREHAAIVVRVHDDGPGIPADERAHVFERFFRGAQTAGVEGSGLGLAIVERATARCGGTVSLEPSAAGTTFALRFPAPDAAAGTTMRIA